MGVENPTFLIESKPTMQDIRKAALQYANLGNRLRLCPGMHMEGVMGEAIDGYFGLQLMDKKENPSLALVNMGFNIYRNYILIAQTPTALPPEQMNARQRRFVGFASNYRETMPQTVVEIARYLGAEYVLGYSTQTHPTIDSKIRKGEIHPDKARKVLDNFYENAGFFKGLDDMYYYLF